MKNKGKIIREFLHESSSIHISCENHTITYIMHDREYLYYIDENSYYDSVLKQHFTMKQFYFHVARLNEVMAFW